MADTKPEKTNTARKADSGKQPILPKRHITFGQRAARKVTVFCGTWKFIFVVLLLIAIWACINMVAWIHHWDPYPFILLNLGLSCLAAIQAPVILMSQNLEADRDRRRSESDYLINRKAEREVVDMQKDLDEIKKLIRGIGK